MVKMDYYNTVDLIFITMKIAKIMQHDAVFILHDEVEHYFLRELSGEEKDLIEQLEDSNEIYLINILYNIANEVYDCRLDIEKDGISSIFFNSKKKNGYKRSIELSHEHDLYRQNYCGCVFSKREAQERDRKRVLENSGD